MWLNCFITKIKFLKPLNFPPMSQTLTVSTHDSNEKKHILSFAIHIQYLGVHYCMYFYIFQKKIKVVRPLIDPCHIYFYVKCETTHVSVVAFLIIVVFVSIVVVVYLIMLKISKKISDLFFVFLKFQVNLSTDICRVFMR